ncbi:polyphosphate kinase 2 [Thalassospiraceae bacterium LMO-JJ14]|nr:polyphosphate kinase 2 [Thalassospiraceae bacterium LMO-JJ14]
MPPVKQDAPVKLSGKKYYKELRRLQVELIKLQEWVRHEGLKVAVLFEGRDGAGKGGTIKRITELTNPRIVRIEALGRPTERERSEWYFQRYVACLPAAGEVVLFDRSWYNRAGVERVMGFCSDEEYWEFLRETPQFESMLMRSGIKLIKYWFSVSAEEQESRFQARRKDPTKFWKLSPMDLKARTMWGEYSIAKDIMFEHTDVDESPWWVVPSDHKKSARLNCISHLLSQFDYVDVIPEPPPLGKRPKHTDPQRPPIEMQRIVPLRYDRDG